MILVLDIGNSFIKTGIFNRDELVFTKKVKTDSFSVDLFNDYSIDKCAISSVVPSATVYVKEMIGEKLHIIPSILTSKSKFSLKIDYSTPDTLGIDRICGAEGALKLFMEKYKTFESGKAIFSIDFGTATTINLIKHPGVFTGGIIAPGIRMMFEALNKNTSQLPDVDFSEYKKISGDSTASAIASGVLNSALGLIERTRYSLTGEIQAENIYTYITGGNAGSILPYLNFNYEYVPHLVLYGIYSALLQN